MGKLKILSGRDVCRLLQKYGFKEIRRKGSHILMQKLITGSTITVPVPIKISNIFRLKIKKAGKTRLFVCC